ncbi:MAG TPA: S8 family serine peptidase [Gemmatimonadaceae bacterium]
MTRSRLSVSLVTVLALAACTIDQSGPVSPIASTRAVRSVSGSAASRYLVLASNSGFSSDFEASVAALGGTIEQFHGSAGIAVVSGVSDATAAQIAALRGVSDVQPDADISLNAPLAAATADVTAVGDPSISSVGNPATAGLYSWQWNMRAIHANQAWAGGKLGSSTVTVAIIDTGIDYDDPDLNGLVDLSRSVSFVPSDDAITAHFFPTRNPITDYNGHGTNVAAQVSSKAVVFAGVTSKTTLIGVKVIGFSGSGSFSAILNGVLWAADHGANVANMSLGGAFAKAGNGRFAALLNRVFNYANKKGMLIVVAAGNESADLDHDGNSDQTFCSQSHVICVSATGPVTAAGNVDLPAYYTNFGRSAISVAGPGGNADAANGFPVSLWPWGPDIASWVWSFCSKTTLAVVTPAGIPVLAGCQAGNRITGFIGTSQATPHVAGLAASLMAEQGTGQPSQIKNAIEKSADDLGQPGTDPFYGRGRINVAKAFGM